MGMASRYVIVAKNVTSVSKPNCGTMVQCCVPSCNNRNDVNKTICYYRFPLDENEKRRWLKLIRRKDFTPNHNSRTSNQTAKENAPSDCRGRRKSGTRPKSPLHCSKDPKYFECFGARN
uniref:THAP-type domain-containing protein n=1 Tax=Knipowitschia caucasica TaxID=637954 RepID=A0AAV2J5T6_KNICA